MKPHHLASIATALVWSCSPAFAQLTVLRMDDTVDGYTTDTPGLADVPVHDDPPIGDADDQWGFNNTNGQALTGAGTEADHLANYVWGSRVDKGEDAPAQQTTVTGLDAGESYNIYAYIVTHTGQAWGMQLALNGGELATMVGGDGEVIDQPSLVLERMFLGQVSGVSTVTIESDDLPVGGAVRSFLKGIGVEIPPDPGLLIESSFSLQHGGAVEPLSLPFTNNGATQDLVITSADPAPLDTAFASATFTSPVSPSESGTIELPFTPAGPGSYSTILTIVSNDSGTPSWEVSIEVEVIDPWLSAPDTLDFGSFASNPGPQTASITISNLGGTQPLTIGDTSGTDNPTYFNLTTNLPLVIPVGGSANLDIEFTPGTDEGLFEGTLFIDSDDSLTFTTTISLTAEVAPEGGGFDSWAEGFGIPNDTNDDSDLDGIPALDEYGLGYDPTVFDSMPVPVPSGDDHTVTWPKGAEAATDSEISYLVEVSSDLLSWAAPVPPNNLAESAAELVLTLAAGQDKIFARLSVVRTP